jgi:hypothetical protein
MQIRKKAHLFWKHLYETITFYDCAGSDTDAGIPACYFFYC